MASFKGIIEDEGVVPNLFAINFFTVSSETFLPNKYCHMYWAAN